MKIMNKFQKKLTNRKEDNKGFSLVELIIVIAIMAILVGIVGTQVLPYINKSKEAKDFQIINSFGTAATTAYSSNAEKITAIKEFTIYTPPTDADELVVYNDILDLTGYKNLTTLQGKMGSKNGKKISKVVIQINPTDSDSTTGLKAAAKTIVTQAYYTEGSGSGATENKLFDQVVTQL